MSSSGWCTVESDPGVFTELVSEMGARGVSVEELWSLDEDSLRALGKVHGLIFLFKWRAEQDSRPVVADGAAPNVFFAKQVITNACATQALLSILLNAEGVELGDTLSDFKAFVADFPADLKGLAISNQEAIRAAHNSFARPEPFVSDERVAQPDDDVFHFISYVRVGSTLYELDGLKEGPIVCAEGVGDADWLGSAAAAVQARIERYAASEIKFNLMAMCESKQTALTRQREAAEARLVALADGAAPMDTGDGSSLPEGEEALADERARLMAEIADVDAQLAADGDKRARWKEENARRKHNYVPFVYNFLRLLAEHKQLKPLVDAARQRQEQRRQQQQ